MDLLFDCPLPTAVTTIPAPGCAVKFDQIQRWFLQRVQSSGFMTTTTVLLQATWTALITAVAGTKVQGSPLFSGLTIPPGEALTEGGNTNDTLNGIPELRGLGFVHVTGTFKNLDSATRTALRAYTKESVYPAAGQTNLWAFGVNRFDQLIYTKSGTNVLGIKLYNFVTADIGTAGFNADNMIPFSFDLAPGWSDGVEVLNVPAFSLLNLPNV